MYIKRERLFTHSNLQSLCTNLTKSLLVFDQDTLFDENIQILNLFLQISWQTQQNKESFLFKLRQVSTLHGCTDGTQSVWRSIDLKRSSKQMQTSSMHNDFCIFFFFSHFLPPQQFLRIENTTWTVTQLYRERNIECIDCKNKWLLLFPSCFL